MDADDYIMVALAVAGNTADAFAPKSNLRTGLSAGRNTDFDGSVDGFDFGNSTKCCLRKGDFFFGNDIVSPSSEITVGGNLANKNKVGKTDFRTIVNSCWDFDFLFSIFHFDFFLDSMNRFHEIQMNNVAGKSGLPAKWRSFTKNHLKNIKRIGESAKVETTHVAA